MEKTVAIIPARKGSKRLPGKNVKPLLGRPLVEYSLKHAAAAKKLDGIVVSTDDEEVTRIAAPYSLELIKRPRELAGDSVSTLAVIRHALETLAANGKRAGYAVILQPTTPLRRPGLIDEAVALLHESGCDAVISHIRVDYFHPNRMKRIVDGRVLPYVEAEIEGVSRQTLPEAYYRDGAVYACRSDTVLRHNTLFGKDVRAVLNERRHFVNIDEDRDWVIAEWLLRQYPELDPFLNTAAPG